jgi:ethanolaminephosphotransferase
MIIGIKKKKVGLHSPILLMEQMSEKKRRKRNEPNKMMSELFSRSHLWKKFSYSCLINDEDLKRFHYLKEYRYYGVDRSILSRLFYNRLWNWMFLKFIPIWVAPNVLTLIGLVLTSLCATITIFLGPLRKEWFAVCSLSCFLYAFLDAVDGKQARRTHSSSPLGEMFDHGCDSLNIIVIAVLSTQAIGIPLTSWWFVATLCGALLGFYVCTWEEYYTHVLYLPVINGPVEGATALQLMMLLSAWKGPAWFTTNRIPLKLFGWQPSFAHTIMLIMIVSLVMQIAFSICTVLRHLSRHEDKFTMAVAGCYSFILVLSTTLIWVYHSPLNFVAHQSRIILLAIGLSLSSSLTLIRIILRRVIHGPFPYFNETSVFVAIGAANAAYLRGFNR